MCARVGAYIGIWTQREFATGVCEGGAHIKPSRKVLIILVIPKTFFCFYSFFDILLIYQYVTHFSISII